METLRISPRIFTVWDFAPLFTGPVHVALTDSSIKNLKRSHKRLEKIITSGKTIYGVNTGFGKLV